MSTCIVCHNETQRQHIPYIQEFNGDWSAVNGVMADVCPVCGEQYFDSDTVDKIQASINSQKPIKSLYIPLYDLRQAII